MFEKLISIATGRNTVRALIAALVFMILMNIGATAFFRFTHGVGVLDTAGGANLLDQRSGYSPESAYEMISAYGGQGVRYYMLFTVADTFFPLTLTFFLLLATIYFYRPFFQTHPLTRGLAALPIVYLASDYLENVSIITMLLNFPTRMPGMARLAHLAFTSKNISSNLAVVVILIGLGLCALQRWSHQNELSAGA